MSLGRLKRALLGLVCICCLAPGLAQGEAANPAQPRPRAAWAEAPKAVLVLYSAGFYLPAYRKNIAAFFSVMEGAGFPVDKLYFEYLDLIRDNTPEHRRKLLDLLRWKYADNKIDLIVTVEGLARDFMLGEGRNLQPDAPLVAALSADILATVAPPRRVVQIPSVLDMAGTLRLGLELFPHTRRVFVVVGAGEDEKRWERDAREQFAPWADKVQFEYSSDLAYEDTLRRIGSLPPDSLVIYIALYRDRTGRSFVPRDAAIALTRQANAPVFGVYDEITPLVVGGSMISYALEGARTAQLGLDILAGKFPLDQTLTTLPILSRPNFNWTQLKRWGVGAQTLPEGSIVINRPSSIWDDYREFVIGGLALVALQTGMILALFALLRRSRTAESTRHQAEERYRRIVDTANEGIWTIDGSHDTTFVNQKMASMLGYAPEEMLGQPHEGFLHPEEREAFHAGLGKRRQNLGETLERRYLHKDGRVIWVSVNATPIMDERGEVAGSFAMYTDVTERKRMEEELRKSEERYRQVVDNANEAIVVIQDGRIKFYNPKAVPDTGLSSEYCQEVPFAQFIHPLDREMVVEFNRRRMAGEGAPAQYDARVADKSGQVKWIRANVVTILWEGRQAALSFISDITEQKSAEEELRASEERFRLLFDSAADAIFIRDLDGRFLAVNETACQRLGYRRDELINMSVSDIDETTPAELLASRTQELLAHGHLICEVGMVAKDGSKIPTEIHARSLTMDGKPVVMTVARDISERKRAEESLRRALSDLRKRAEEVEALLRGARVVLEHKEFTPAARKVFDLCKDLLGATAGYVALRAKEGSLNEVLFLEAGGRPCTVDSELPMPIRGLREMAYAQRKVVWENSFAKSPWQRFLPPGHVALDNALFAPLIVDGQAIGVIGLANKPGGFDDNDARLAMAFGEVTALAWRNGDLLDTLEASENRFRNLYENMSNGVAVFEAVDQGSDFVCREINRAGQRICQMDSAGIIGRRISEALPGVLDMGLLEVIKEVWRTGESQTHSTMRYQDQRLLLWVEDYVYKLTSGEVVAIFDDISAAKQAEEERSRLEAQLRQAQKMEAIGTLAGGIAHDFNNILQAMMGFGEASLDILEDGEDCSEEIRQILLAVQRARKLVRQILTFSRKVQYQMRPLSLNESIENVKALLAHTLPKSIAIETELEASLPLVRADANQVEQVILNLAANAADAMSDGGRLRIQTRFAFLESDDDELPQEVTPGPYVLLTVSDTGQGISPEDMNRIFDPFFTTKEVGKGTGLGLSTVFGIVKSHGGHINCRSEPDQGTTFRVYLPVMREGQPEPADEGNSTPEPTSRGRGTILLVDDEETLRLLGLKNLEGSGYTTLTAASGEEALDTYRKQWAQIDLVIMDLGMPGMGGLKALKHIQEINPRAKVLIASGYAANTHVRAALESGAAGHVGKPFTREELLSAVSKALGKS